MKIKFDQGDEMSPLTKKIMGAFNFCGDKLLWLAGKIDAVPGNGLEIFFLMLYVVLYFLTAVVHEPGTDVLASWNFAKEASLSRILFQIPHEQFCPPLWNLILMPFAKMGAAPTAISGIGLVFAVFAVALVLFKAPFSRIIRIMLPFTYFLFYQYGVAAGNYHLTVLAFILAAVTYQKRNTQSAKYILSLILLGLSSSYGLVISFGLGIYQAFKQFQSKDKEKISWLWLAVLFVSSVCIFLQSIPYRHVDAGSGMDIFVKLVYLLFSAVSDAILTNAFYGNTTLGADTVRFSFLLESALIGVVLLLLVIYCGRKKKTLGLFFAPYSLFILFSIFAGYSREQTGIVFLFVLFWSWISSQDKTDILNTVKWRERDKKALKSASVIAFVFVFAVNLNWTCTACLHDMNKEYGIGPVEAEFLKENKLDSYNIMAGQQYLHTLTPYVDEKQLGSDSAEKDNLAKWKKLGQPDILYMSPDLARIWDEEKMTDWKYTLVYLSAVETIWKTETDYEVASIYVQSDLAKELGLKEITKKFPEMR